VIMAFFKTVKPIKWAALVAAVLLHGPLYAAQMESAQDLMARMSKASRELNYQGLFTYEYRGNLTSVKVSHGVFEGQTFERILHMDGAKREALSRIGNLDCLRTGDMLLRGSAYKISEQSYARLEDYYDFHIKGDGRIANRDVVMVHVLPKDKHRYGYVVAIDRDSGLLLQSVLMSHRGKPLERFQFVDIAVGMPIAELGFDLQMTYDKSVALEQTGCVGADRKIRESVSSWSSQWLPPGFVIASHQSTDKGRAELGFDLQTTYDKSVALEQTGCVGADRQIRESVSSWSSQWLPPGFVIASHQSTDKGRQESMMYTDGLAVFSVFIDSDNGRSLPAIDANLGATVAVLTKANFNDHEYAISVVGEIPRATANQIANAIALSPGDEQQ